VSDRLLEVISTRGKMSLDDFDIAFDHLVPLADSEDRVFARRSTLSALEALGHCEIDWNRRLLFACRPILARLPVAGCPRIVLAGARVTQTVMALKNYAKAHQEIADFSCTSQVRGLPDVITLEVADELTLAQCATVCNLPLSGKLPVAWTLANVSGCLADYKSTLAWKPDASLNWRRRIFDPTAPFFRREDDPKAAPILSHSARLTEHTNPVTQQRDWRWTKDGSYALVARDWGRWLALAAANVRVLLYDTHRQRLAVPSSTPLPRLLARGATLCSGRASYTDDLLRQNVYDSVPPALASLIAHKCGQSCKSATLERASDRG
jgi:hypothetical protein